MKAKHIALVLSATLASTLTGFAAGALRQEAVTPTDQHEWMKGHVGEWTAKVSVMGQESVGSWTVRSAHGGLWNVGEFEGSMMGGPFTGTEIFGYDTEKKAFVSVWVDSTASSLGVLEGQYDADAKKLVMKGESVGMDGQPVEMTNTTEYPSEDRMVFTMSVPGPDGADMPMMTIDYERKK